MHIPEIRSHAGFQTLKPIFPRAKPSIKANPRGQHRFSDSALSSPFLGADYFAFPRRLFYAEPIIAIAASCRPAIDGDLGRFKVQCLLTFASLQNSNCLSRIRSLDSFEARLRNETYGVHPH